MLPSGDNGFVWPIGMPQGGRSLNPGAPPASSGGSLLGAFGGGDGGGIGNPTGGAGISGIGSAPSASTSLGGVNFTAGLPSGLTMGLPGVNLGVSPFGSFNVSPNVSSTPGVNSILGSLIGRGASAAGVPTGFNLAGMLSPAFGSLMGALGSAFAGPVGLVTSLGPMLESVMANHGINTTQNMLSAIQGLFADPNLSPEQALEIANQSMQFAFGPTGSILGALGAGQAGGHGPQGGHNANDPNAPAGFFDPDPTEPTAPTAPSANDPAGQESADE